MRKNHNLSTYVAFVDLVKAYDTVDHDLIVELLEIFGAPPTPRFVDAMRRTYHDLKVVEKIRKEMETIQQGVGVRLGDNMAPVLFLFLMSAFAEILEIEWRAAEIPTVKVRTVSERDFAAGKGAIRGHSRSQYTSKSLTAFEIVQCLYVDDGAFVFDTCANLCKGLNLIHRVFGRFGLEMHIGREDKASKTECVYFPPPRAPTLDTITLPSKPLSHGEGTEALIEAAATTHETERARADREGACYDALEEQRP